MLQGVDRAWTLDIFFKKCVWLGQCDPVNVWALNANSSKTAKATDFLNSSKSIGDKTDKSVGSNKAPIRNVCSGDWWCHITLKAKVVIRIYLQLNISKTSQDSRSVVSGTVNCKSIDHVTYDITWPSKMKVMTPIHLSLNILTTVQTAAMGQIPYSTERIHVNIITLAHLVM